MKYINKKAPRQETWGFLFSQECKAYLARVNQSGATLQELSQTKLEALEPVTEKLAESKQQLLDYQTGLESKYGKIFKWQLISVVAVGFDRLVWKNIPKS